MTVAELIAALQQLPPDAQVVRWLDDGGCDFVGIGEPQQRDIIELDYGYESASWLDDDTDGIFAHLRRRPRVKAVIL